MAATFFWRTEGLFFSSDTHQNIKRRIMTERLTEIFRSTEEQRKNSNCATKNLEKEMIAANTSLIKIPCCLEVVEVIMKKISWIYAKL